MATGDLLPVTIPDVPEPDPSILTCASYERRRLHHESISQTDTHTAPSRTIRHAGHKVHLKGSGLAVLVCKGIMQRYQEVINCKLKFQLNFGRSKNVDS